MGTNFYAVRTRPTVEEPIHIGKMSRGWLFLFNGYNDISHDPPIIWNTYNQVKEWLYHNTVDKKDYVILNEYDEPIKFDDFFEMIDKWQTDEENLNNPDNFKWCKNVDGYRFSYAIFS